MIVSFLINDTTIFTSNYVELNPVAYTTRREFVFKNISIKNSIYLLDKDNAAIRVKIIDKNRKEKSIYYVELFLITVDELIEGKDFSVGGFVINQFEEYEQGVVDIFNVWQTGSELNWREFDTRIDLKHSYFTACRLWFSNSKLIYCSKEEEINCELIKDEADLFYYISKCLFEEKAYAGYSMHTFEDRLVGLPKVNHDVNLVFTNFNSIEDRFVKNRLLDIGDFLKRRGVLIEYT